MNVSVLKSYCLGSPTDKEKKPYIKDVEKHV